MSREMALDNLIRLKEAIEDLKMSTGTSNYDWYYRNIGNRLDALDSYLTLDVGKEMEASADIITDLQDKIDELNNDLDYAKMVLGELMIYFRKECHDEE